MERRSDIALMRAARTDSRAFGELYERHAVAIHGWLRNRVGEPAATDLTAETFAAAWQSRRRFRAEHADSVAPWLYGIALNQYRSYQRLARVETTARARLGMQETLRGGARDRGCRRAPVGRAGAPGAAQRARRPHGRISAARWSCG